MKLRMAPIIACLLVLAAAWAAKGETPTTAPVLKTASTSPLKDGDTPKNPEPKRPWTILVYGAVDNSADGPLIAFLNQVRRAIDDDAGLDLLLLIDRSAKHPKRANYLGEDFTGTRLYRLRKNSVERLGGGAQFPEITTDKDVELNSADAANVGRFIAWGK